MKNKSYTLCAIVILFLISQLINAMAIPEENLHNKIDSFVFAAIEAGFSGAVLVAVDGKMTLLKGYGLADRE